MVPFSFFVNSERHLLCIEKVGILSENFGNIKPVFMSYEDESILKQYACCDLTLNVTDWTDIFVKPVFKQIIAESLNYFVAKKDLVVYGWCLMTNHLHLIAQAKGSIPLTILANEFKEFTTKIILEDIDAESEVRKNWIMKRFREAGKPLRLIDKFQVWQKSLNHIYIDLENQDVINEHLEYIHNHPVRDRIVSKPEDYLYSSARDYVGLKGLVNVNMVEEKNKSSFILRHISSY